MTLPEVLIASALTVGLTGAVFAVVAPVHGIVQAQPEAADLQQRLRVAVETLRRAIMPAHDVVPRRLGAVNADPAGTVRDDAMSVVTGEGTMTYYLRTDPAAGVFALMRYDGAQTDLPVVDHVAALRFEYFGGPAGAPPGPLDSAQLAADGALVRRVRIILRVQAAPAALRGPAGPLFANPGTSSSSWRFVPDQEATVDVALRHR